jgi:hypothetical protein
MIRPIGPLRNSWVYQHLAQAARAEPPSPAPPPDAQLEALERRRLLDAQQQQFQGGHTDAKVPAPYAHRFRPPS